MTTKLIQCLCAVALAGLLLAACGGGSEEMTQAQFLRRADAICGKTEGRQEVALAAFSQKHPTTDLNDESVAKEVVLMVGLPAIAKELEEVRQLGLPSTGAKQAEAFIAATEAAIAAAEAKPELMLTPTTNPFNQPEALARKLGLKVCGSA